MITPSSRCQECPLFTRLHEYVPARGPENAKLAFVGEAPGYHEVAHNPRTPFVGPAGQMFNDMLKGAGIRREEVLVTNVLKCHPKDNKLPQEYELERAVACCSELLEKDLKQAKVVIGMGNVPLKALVGLERITLRRGSVYELEDGRPYVAALHPAFLMRSRYVKDKQGAGQTKVIPKEVAIADFARAKRIAEGEEWRPKEHYIMEPTRQDLDDFLVRLHKPEFMVTIDIEAPKVRPIMAVPTVVGFYVDGLGVCVDFEEELEFVVQALASPTPKNFQNGIYDVLVFTNLGIEVMKWEWDSYLIHHLLYAELSHKLHFIQSLHAYLPYHKSMREEIALFNEDLEETYDK